MKIRISKEDKKFSEITRRKAKGYCEYCHKWFGWKSLQTSHYKGRRNKSVRWFPDNVSAICFTCHNLLGENPDIHTRWFEKRLGPQRFALLLIKAATPGMPDMWALNRWLDEELEKTRLEWDHPDHEPSLGNTDWVDKEYQSWLQTPKKQAMPFKEWLARKIKDNE
jgi:hypothetical protein